MSNDNSTTGEHSGASPCSADFDDDYDGEYDPERNCMTCGGDGWEDSDSLMEEDPLWWDGVDMIPCRNCGGSGLRKDQTCF